MAFNALEVRGLTHMCCGHQHQHVCCRRTLDGITNYHLEFKRVKTGSDNGEINLEVARVPLDVPTLSRIGGCHGPVAGVCIHRFFNILFYQDP